MIFLCWLGLHRWTRMWWGHCNPYGRFGTYNFRKCRRCNRHQWRNCYLICHLFKNCMRWEDFDGSRPLVCRHGMYLESR